VTPTDPVTFPVSVCQSVIIRTANSGLPCRLVADDPSAGVLEFTPDRKESISSSPVVLATMNQISGKRFRVSLRSYFKPFGPQATYAREL
jgi:hypothetical protein